MRIRTPGHLFLVTAILLIPVAGYGIMHGIIYLFPLAEDSVVAHLLVTLLIIALGLIIPYWMLKLEFTNERRRNRQEEELRLSDLPKNQRKAEKPDTRKPPAQPLGNR